MLHSRSPPASCFTHSDVYLSTLLPQFAPPSPFPAVSACLLSMSAPLFLPCKYSPGDLPYPGIKPGSPALQADALPPEPPDIAISSVQFSSVAQSCLTLCDPMNHSMPGLPVHHQFLEFTQTHVHRVSDAIQPSHPLLSPSPPAPNPSQQ